MANSVSRTPTQVCRAGEKGSPMGSKCSPSRLQAKTVSAWAKPVGVSVMRKVIFSWLSGSSASTVS